MRPAASCSPAASGRRSARSASPPISTSGATRPAPPCCASGAPAPARPDGPTHQCSPSPTSRRLLDRRARELGSASRSGAGPRSPRWSRTPAASPSAWRRRHRPGPLRGRAATAPTARVRDLRGIAVHDLGFRYDWLIVDVVLDQPRIFDPLNLQICDPARPTTAVSGGPGRRRWEFMRLPGETLDELNARPAPGSSSPPGTCTPATPGSSGTPSTRSAPGTPSSGAPAGCSWPATPPT